MQHSDAKRAAFEKAYTAMPETYAWSTGDYAGVGLVLAWLLAWLVLSVVLRRKWRREGNLGEDFFGMD